MPAARFAFSIGRFWGYFRSNNRSQKRDYSSGLHISFNTQSFFENPFWDIITHRFIALKPVEKAGKNLT